MRRCSACGSEWPDDILYCGTCGARTDAEAPSEEESPVPGPETRDQAPTMEEHPCSAESQEAEDAPDEEGRPDAEGGSRARAEARREERRARKEHAREVRTLWKGLRRRRKAGGRAARTEGDDDEAAGLELSPNATQDILGFEAMYPDGISRIGNGRWSSCLLFDDVAWMSVREEEKEDTASIWGEFLDGLSSENDLCVWLLSKTIDQRNFLSELALSPVPGDEVGNPLRSEFNAYVRSKIAASTKSMRRTRALIVTTTADGHDEAAQKLGLIHIRAAALFNTLDAFCHVLNGQERLDLIRQVTRPDAAEGKVSWKNLEVQPFLTTRDLAAPERVVRLDDGDLMVGNRWVRSYTVTKYARTVRDSFLSQLTQLPVDLTVTLHVRPWSRSKAISLAQHHVYAVGTEANTFKLQRSKPERGYFVDNEDLPPDIKDSISEADSLRNKIVEGNQHLFSVTMIVTVFARSAEDLAASCKQVETVFSEQLIEEVDTWYCLREQAFTSSLPTGARTMPNAYETTMLTEALEVYAPFSSVEVMDPNGMLMGINAETNNFISYDQSLHEDTNSFILGMPGKGKSVMAKLETLQKFLRERDADIILIDPEAENVELMRAIGGSIIDISETSRSHINLMEMSEFYGATDPDSAGNPLPRKVDFLQSAIKLMANSVSDEEKNVIDAAAAYVYADYLESHDPDDLPTLQDLYDYLIRVEGSTREDARHLASLISRYVTGTFSVFNHATDVDLKNRVVDFVVTDLNDDLKPLAMMVVMDYVWSRVTENRRVGRRTYLLIDETQLLLEEPVVCKWLDRFFSRGRKWDFYISCVTQNVQRVLDIPECSYMFENTPLLVLTGQARRAAHLLADILGLSSSQQRTLEHAQPGEGLYVFRHKVIHYDFRIDREVCPKIFGLVTTKPADLKRSRKQRERRRLAQESERASEEIERATEVLRKAVTSGTMDLSEIERALSAGSEEGATRS